MISVEKSIKIILNDVIALKSEKVHISDALDRVLAHDIVSNRNIPHSDNSAMDGYALSCQDTKGAVPAAPVMLKLIGESRAGTPFKKSVPKGSAVRIMTGALIPKGADAVVKQEDVQTKGGLLYIKSDVKRGQYVRRSGEDIRKGDRLMRKDTILRPADIGILSSLKKKHVYLYKRPAVGILCTGDELVDIDGELKPERIVSSNLYSLSAQVRSVGAVAVSLGIAKDDRRALKRELTKGLKYDILITSGGISVGDYDFVREVLLTMGAKEKIRKVSMRPGKPFSYFTHKSCRIFALPGNPVSSMISFELFVRPAIRKSLGIKHLFNRKLEAVLTESISKIKRYKFFIRAIIKRAPGGYEVRPTGPQGSGILSSMSKANGLIVAVANRARIEKGEKVKVIVLDDNFERRGTF